MGTCQPSPQQTIQVGDISITYLPDGEGHFVPTGMFPASRPEAWAAHERWLDGDGRCVVTIGGFLVRTGDRTVVVDLGAGDLQLDIPGFATATCGSLLDSLRAAGVEPAEVDTVVLTHLHSDHTGWTSGPDGTLAFPNAEHLIGNYSEVEFWRANPEVPFAPAADAVLDPLDTRLTVAPDGHPVAPGVTLRATPGHTPGHQTVVVSSGAERAVIMGDVMHCPVQILEPEWSVFADVDADLARRTRERLLDELEGTDTAVACGHFPEAAFGRVVRGEGRRYWHATP